VLGELLLELSQYPASRRHASGRQPSASSDEVALPLKLRTQGGVLSLLSTVTVFGTPVEITLSELMLEAFYPADSDTAAFFARLQT
jgi:hypothetical protein